MSGVVIILTRGSERVLKFGFPPSTPSRKREREPKEPLRGRFLEFQNTFSVAETPISGAGVFTPLLSVDSLSTEVAGQLGAPAAE